MLDRIRILPRVEDFPVVLIALGSSSFTQKDLDILKATICGKLGWSVHILRCTSLQNAFQLLLDDLLFLSLSNKAVHFIMDSAIICVTYEEALILGI